MYIVRATKGFHPQTQKFERLLTLFQSIKNGTKFAPGSFHLNPDLKVWTTLHNVTNNTTGKRFIWMVTLKDLLDSKVPTILYSIINSTGLGNYWTKPPSAAVTFIPREKKLQILAPNIGRR